MSSVTPFGIAVGRLEATRQQNQNRLNAAIGATEDYINRDKRGFLPPDGVISKQELERTSQLLAAELSKDADATAALRQKRNKSKQEKQTLQKQEQQNRTKLQLLTTIEHLTVHFNFYDSALNGKLDNRLSAKDIEEAENKHDQIKHVDLSQINFADLSSIVSVADSRGKKRDNKIDRQELGDYEQFIQQELKTTKNKEKIKTLRRFQDNITYLKTYYSYYESAKTGNTDGALSSEDIARVSDGAHAKKPAGFASKLGNIALTYGLPVAVGLGVTLFTANPAIGFGAGVAIAGFAGAGAATATSAIVDKAKGKSAKTILANAAINFAFGSIPVGGAVAAKLGSSTIQKLIGPQLTKRISVGELQKILSEQFKINVAGTKMGTI